MYFSRTILHLHNKLYRRWVINTPLYVLGTVILTEPYERLLPEYCFLF